MGGAPGRGTVHAKAWMRRACCTGSWVAPCGFQVMNSPLQKYDPWEKVTFFLKNTAKYMKFKITPYNHLQVYNIAYSQDCKRFDSIWRDLYWCCHITWILWEAGHCAFYVTPLSLLPLPDHCTARPCPPSALEQPIIRQGEEPSELGFSPALILIVVTLSLKVSVQGLLM